MDTKTLREAIAELRRIVAEAAKRPEGFRVGQALPDVRLEDFDWDRGTLDINEVGVDVVLAALDRHIEQRREKVAVGLSYDRDGWPVFRLSHLESLDEAHLRRVCLRIERALNPLAEDEDAVQAIRQAVASVRQAELTYGITNHVSEYTRAVLAALERYLSGEQAA